MRINEQTSLRHMFRRYWSSSSNINNYSTPNTEHSWEDICIQLQNQQTCILIFKTEFGEVWFSILFLQTSRRRFANAHELICCVNLISRSWRPCKTNPNITHVSYVETTSLKGVSFRTANEFSLHWENIITISAQRKAVLKDDRPRLWPLKTARRTAFIFACTINEANMNVEIRRREVKLNICIVKSCCTILWSHAGHRRSVPSFVNE